MADKPGGILATIKNLITRTKGLDDIHDDVVTVDTVVDGIKTKTDNLPADTVAVLSTIQADLDSPSQYKSDATLAKQNAIIVDTEDIQSKLVTVQADLDSPAQYKATGFATPTNVSDVESNIRGADSDTLKSLSDQIDGVGGNGGGSIILLNGACDSGMGASTTTIVSANLTGYGDDYFNDKWWMQIVKNANSVGNAPDGEYRKITDYVSSSGTFTTDAFSANVEENDEIVVIHKSILKPEFHIVADSTASGTYVTFVEVHGSGILYAIAMQNTDDQTEQNIRVTLDGHSYEVIKTRKNLAYIRRDISIVNPTWFVEENETPVVADKYQINLWFKYHLKIEGKVSAGTQAVTIMYGDK